MADYPTPDPLTDALDPLTEDECRRLLGTQTLGRVGITSGGLPCIVPVRYYFEEGAVVFRTGSGSKLHAASSGDVMAFEVDYVDSDTASGWSVLVLGRATVVTTHHEHEGLPSLDPPRVDGPRSHYVYLQCELVTGRTIEVVPPR